MTTTIRLRGPADIITVLPYHLGYRPSECLVLVLLRGPRIGVVARVDLPPPDVDPAAVAGELVPVVLREAPDRALLIGYESRSGSAEASSVALRDALRRAGVAEVERMLVRGGRWWCLDGAPGCCPSEGTRLPPDAEVPAVSDYVVLGRHPAASRSRLGDRMAHTGDPAQDALCAALIQDLDAARASPRVLHRRRRRVLAAWGRILAVPGTTVEDSDWAWAVVGLLDVPLRDLLISWLCPGTLELDAFPVALRRLALGVLPARSRGVTGADAADPVGATDSSDPYRGGDPADPSVGGDPTDSHLRGDTADRAEAADPAGGISGADGLAGLDAAESADLVERLATVCRRSPPELAPGPLTVLAHVAWWLGDGALARTALERALEVDPGYRLAALLERMVDGAVRPRRSA